jgi:hypothetical protein
MSCIVAPAGSGAGVRRLIRHVLGARAAGVWVAAGVLAGAASVRAHPVPEVPVRAFFAADGTATIKIELDTRCFADDPAAAPYLFQKEYAQLSRAERKRLIAEARDYVARTVELRFEPGRATPKWTFDFTTFRERPLERSDDPVMLTGTWRVELNGRESYRVRALPGGKLSVVFLNYYQGKVLKGVQVLFPGEESERLGLTALAEAELGDVYEQLLGSMSPGP